MFSSDTATKKIATVVITIIFIFSGIIAPNNQKASATGIPVVDVSHIAATVAGWAKEAAQWAVTNARWLADHAVKIAVKSAMLRLTLSIVDWIDNGFKGNPAFITDTGRFLQNTADITIGDMLMGTDLNFLCDPFKLQVKLALGLQYRPFKDEIKCSFTGALGNVKDAMNKFTNGDFIGGGGWDSWLQMTTVPQNNQMGAMILAQGELDARIAANKDIQLTEANWGNGFMSWKDCKTVTASVGDTTGDDSVYDEGASRADYYNAKGDVAGTIQENQECTIQTPGSVIANKIGWADTTDIRQVELANDINAIVNALANQATLRTMGLLKIGTDNKFKASTARQDNIDYLNTLQTQVDIQNGVTGSDTGDYNPDGGINFNRTFANRAVALETITSQLAIERQYQTAQVNIYTLLTAAQNTLASSSCSTSVIDDLNSQITGSSSSNLIWNKTDISRVLSITASNISALNTTASAVQEGDDASIPTIIQPLTTMTTLHTAASVSSYSAGGTFYNQIVDWINSQVNNRECTVIDYSNLGV